jgi:CheY-like chemotaxis protein
MMAPAKPFAGRRAAIVEDESLLAMLLEEMLADLGCTVVGSAATIEAAIELVDRERPDVTILDVKLGEHNSFPVARALEALGLPFVFATGYGDTRVDERWRDHPILLKPFAQDQLAQALTQAGSAGGAGSVA